MAGESTGASGSLEANGLRPTDASAVDTTSETGFGGAGSLSAMASACVSGALSGAEEMLATDSTGVSVAVSGSAVDAGVAAVVTTSVDCWSVEDELAGPERFVGALPAELSAVRESRCSADGIVPLRVTCDGSGSSVGDATVDCSSGEVAATAEGTSVRADVASADAVVSLLDEVELVCAPPELCTTPERGSTVALSLDEEVELGWESTELCAVSDVESDGEVAAEADEVADVVASVDAAFAAESDDALDVDGESDGESDDESDELASSGAAYTTAGVFATAPPTPSMNARTLARMMCLASNGKALSG